jgi:hypothetical protein
MEGAVGAAGGGGGGGGERCNRGFDVLIDNSVIFIYILCVIIREKNTISTKIYNRLDYYFTVFIY